MLGEHALPLQTTTQLYTSRWPPALANSAQLLQRRAILAHRRIDIACGDWSFPLPRSLPALLQAVVHPHTGLSVLGYPSGGSIG
jgi:hypothetical protein